MVVRAGGRDGRPGRGAGRLRPSARPQAVAASAHGGPPPIERDDQSRRCDRIPPFARPSYASRDAPAMRHACARTPAMLRHCDQRPSRELHRRSCGDAPAGIVLYQCPGAVAATRRHHTWRASRESALPDRTGLRARGPDGLGPGREAGRARARTPTPGASTRRCTRAGPWTMRQYAGFGTAAESNARYQQLIAHGTTGLSVAFDLPTQMGHDSDAPIAHGEVGKVGRGDRLARRHAGPVRRDPAGPGLHLDDDQRARRAAAAALPAGRRGAGRRRPTG